MSDVAKKTSRRRNPLANVKRHPSERFRAPNQFTERWTNAKAAHIGFLLGQHNSSVDVARLLTDGTSSHTVRAMIRRWDLPMLRRGLLVPLDAYRRGLLAKQAEKLGITEEEFLVRIASCVLNDRLYDAVTDGKYDRK